VLRKLYSIRKPSIETQLQSAKSLNSRLEKWRADVNSFFELDPATLEPLFAAQHIGLQFAYAHARILLHRPFLLQNMNCDAFRGSQGYKLRQECEENTAECVRAAMDIVKLIDGLYQREKNFAASWVSLFVSLLNPQNIDLISAVRALLRLLRGRRSLCSRHQAAVGTGIYLDLVFRSRCNMPIPDKSRR